MKRERKARAENRRGFKGKRFDQGVGMNELEKSRAPVAMKARNKIKRG